MFWFVLTGSILTLLSGAVGQSWADGAVYSNNPAVAVVEGEPITLDDLKNSQIQEAMVQLHEMQKKLLKQKVLGKLALRHPEMLSEKIPAVNHDDVVQFYNNMPGVKELGQLDQMEGEIRQYLDKSFKDAFYESQYRKAVEKGWVVDYFLPPNDYHIVAKIGSAALWFDEGGESRRKVLLLEYSDFQCPFCKRVQATLNKLRRRYEDKVQFGYRHFPLPFHKEARGLAEAAECAREQGRFWELQASFYEASPAALQRSDILKSAAEQAGVKNMSAFQSCLGKGKYRNRVLQDVQEGLNLGIQGTPAFIVGVYDQKKATVTGEMFSGAVSEENFVRKIESYIAITESGEAPSSASADLPATARK
ncbi:MAG: thioredoxin domain-containing protein [Nitrospinae bacterium]|nr:thioredoxin domain-containing protein [Nitrospinota bacterium]